MPLRPRLGQTNSPERKKKSDIRKTSCQAQYKSKPNHRWLSTIGKARQRYGGAVDANGAAPTKRRKAKTQKNDRARGGTKKRRESRTKTERGNNEPRRFRAAISYEIPGEPLHA